MTTCELPRAGAGHRGSMILSASHDKRNLWWKSFRKTVLEPHSIDILDNTVLHHVPSELLKLTEEMCQNLDRHEQQAKDFRVAVTHGKGFGPSPIFPPDIVPPVDEEALLARCMEPTFDTQTLPPPQISLRVPSYEMPAPRPGLACGFSSKAFTEVELEELPQWLVPVGMISDYGNGEIQPGQAVHCPFLLFERTYGHAKHEIEAAMNYCAMNGSAALNAIKMLYDRAWQGDSSRPLNPAVFSCTIDDDVAIIHHHWLDEHNTFLVAPLCKFDFRDPEHFMHFLAWIEAIESWAKYFLLPDVKETLAELITQREAGILGVPRALSSPFTYEEKQEKLKQSLKLAFDNIPWKGDRPRGTPLGITSTMRMRSPRPAETSGPAISPMLLNNASSIQVPSDCVAMHTEATPSIFPEFTSQPTVLPTLTKNTRSAASPPPMPINLISVAPNEVNHHPGPMRPPDLPAPGRTSKPTLNILDLEKSSVVMDSNSTHFPETAVSSATLSTTRDNSTPATETPDKPQPASSKSATFANTSLPVPSPSSMAITTATVSAKKSFASLRKENKRIRSPQTPEFLGPSPKSGGFMSKLGGIIKSKRVRTDNAGPPTPKPGDFPLPTPAYDKRRFEVPSTSSSPASTNAWVEHVLQDRIIVGDERSTSTPGPVLQQSSSSNFLPLRQYHEGAVRTTVTTGPL